MQKNIEPVFRMHSLDRFSLAVDEIRVKRNLEKLMRLAERYGSGGPPRDLLDEIAAQQRTLKKLKVDRDRDPTDNHRI